MRRALARGLSWELQAQTAHCRSWLWRHEQMQPKSRTSFSSCYCIGKTPSSSLTTRSFSQHIGDGNSGHYFGPHFWDTTYLKESEPLEWYRSYSELSRLLKKYIPSNSRVLMSGCGNSEFSEDMVKDGYTEVVNIDISPVVISAMQKKYKNLPQLTYISMDAVDLSAFDESSFDAVIDKGTMDAIMCVEGGPYNVAMMLAEISRVLKAGGVYTLVTFASPQVSFPLLNRDAFGWNIDTYIIDEPGSLQAPWHEPVFVNSDGGHVDDNVVKKACLYVYMCVTP